MHRASRKSSVSPAGTRVAGRYEIRSVLGHGGSSIVYEARDLESGRAVALKVLDAAPERGAAERAVERERMFREARIGGQLRHEGIVRVLDAGPLEGGEAFLVMERLEGHTLGRRMQGCFWLPLEDALEIATQLLSALGAAHAAGVVHRDVNPANVFLLGGSELRVKLIDFGIGRHLGDPSTRVTQPDVVVGTLGYMAPEQLFGDSPTIRSDLYGVGATLYEMLGGRRPHDILDGDVRDVLCAMVEPVEPLESLRPTVPPALARGVMRSLARRPDDRPDTCRAMLEDCGLVPLAA